MRNVAIRGMATIGVVGSLVALTYLGCPCVAAASLLLAIVGGLAGIGLTIDAYLDHREHVIPAGDVPTGTPDGTCQWCRGRMVTMSSIHVCPTCDRAPAHRMLGRHQHG